MNTLAHYFVPDWISVFFIISIPFPFILLTLFINKQAQKSGPAIMAAVFFTFYLAYISLAGYLGWFNRVSFPPRVLLLTTFPFATLLFMAVPHTAVYKTIMQKDTAEALIRLHIFRLLGLFFLLLAYHDTLPKSFAIIAGTGDMITAVSSIFVANALRQKKSYARKVALAWNLFGAIDILFTAIAANVLTKISIDTGSMGVDTLARFPFCIIPAFAPPTILFLHWTIHQQLKKYWP